MLDFFFKQYAFRYGRFGLGFFRVFGAVMVGQAGILLIGSMIIAVAKMLGKEIG